ncbi:MAG: efflux RND transporter periplasmic adaptor subunit [Treponema sp.]|jgi:multidrug efflux pump subunit AcrA (membrane-fusion protein)|nr:efflux RND transporter periplasmic adaptor subunit [Treponema sp.]
MKKLPVIRRATIISAVIIALIVVFAVLIIFTVIKRRQGANTSAAASAPVTSNTPGGQQGGGGPPGGGRNATVVQVTVVEPGTIENSVVINGDVLAQNQVSIFPTVGGKLVEARITIGDRVSRGDVVAMVDPSRPGEVYSHSPVVSTISGTVLQAPYSIGDTVSAQSALYVLGDLSSLRVETAIPERFVSSVRQGLGATVMFEAIPGETFFAEVDEVSPVLDAASRTLRIRLRFVNRQGRLVIDPRIRAGMFSTVSLVTRTRTNVPVIPRTSVINTYGSWIVFTVDENNIARRHTVELGIENESLFEVLSGVNLGDRVVSAGQNFLSDGDPVRVVE